ncbi:MAG: glycosyltransferase family 2 protein [Methylobacter sp.]
MQKNNDFPMDRVENLPLVSIIVRTKNRPALLMEALQSIARQTYPKIETVIVNDGGSDIGEIVDSFTSSVAVMQLIQLPESAGRSGAANAGLKQATGEWIGFLDDDDLLAASHVQQLVEFALLNEARVVYSGTKVIQINQDGATHEVAEYNVPYSAERLLYENFIPIHSVLLQRELIDNGVCFDTDFDFFEDWDFWLQVSRKTAFLHSPSITAIYHLHSHASGVHQPYNKISHYLHIYKKWLSDAPVEKIFSLLQKSHQWFEDTVAALQEANGKKLDEIGQRHGYAQQIVQERDAQLRECQAQLDEIGQRHGYAQQIVQERDAQLRECHIQIKNLTNELDEIKKTVFWSAYTRLMK